jgi:pyruvate dehydrogenase E2 component (dihydrolipoamide acetyltransferase)
MLELVRQAAHHGLRLRGARHLERRVGEATFRYYHLGRGPQVVVLLHGLGDTAVNWRWVARAIARGAEVVIPDLPGFGLSDLPPDRTCWNVQEYADAVHAFLAPWHDRRPLLVGNSMGGWVSSLLLVDRADQYGSAILINPGGAMVPDRDAALESFRSFVATATGPAILERLIHRPARHWRLIGPGLERQMRAPVVQDFLGTLEDGHLFLPERVGRLPDHCLLVWGEEDRFLPEGTADAWFGTFPGDIVRLPQVSHMAQVERPARIAELIRQHLRACG